MNSSVPLPTFLHALGLIQGCVIGGVFLWLHRRDQPLRWLGLFLIAYSLPLVAYIIQATGLMKQYPRLNYLPIGFYFAGLPLFYLYARSLTGRLSRSVILRNLTPAMLELVLITTIFCLPNKVFSAFYNGPYRQLFGLVFTVTLDVFCIGYAIVIIRLLRQHRKRVADFYADLHGRLLGWVSTTAWVLLGLYLAEIVFAFLIYNVVAAQVYLLLSAVLSVLFIYWVAISGLRQSHVRMAFPAEDPAATTLAPAAVDLLTESVTLARPDESRAALVFEAPATTEHGAPAESLTDEEALSKELHFAKIIQVMEAGAYKNPDLTLMSLADQLALSYKQVSALINDMAGMNFNKFVNQYRVEEAKRLLRAADYAHLNHTGIAQEAGFHAKSTFYRMFREFTGRTPSQFQRESAT